MEEDERTKSYYLTTQLAAARLAMAATQLERVVLGDSCRSYISYCLGYS